MNRKRPAYSGVRHELRFESSIRFKALWFAHNRRWAFIFSTAASLFNPFSKGKLNDLNILFTIFLIRDRSSQAAYSNPTFLLYNLEYQGFPDYNLDLWIMMTLGRRVGSINASISKVESIYPTEAAEHNKGLGTNLSFSSDLPYPFGVKMLMVTVEIDAICKENRTKTILLGGGLTSNKCKRLVLNMSAVVYMYYRYICYPSF